MKRITNTFLIFMICVFALSSVAMIGALFSNDDAANTVIRKPNITDGDFDPIVLPDFGSTILKTSDITFHEDKISKDNEGYLSLNGEYIVYNGEAEYDYYSVDKESPFVQIGLIDPLDASEIYTNGIAMANYSHIKVEFDILNDYKCYADISSMLGCSIYPVGRGISATGVTTGVNKNSFINTNNANGDGKFGITAPTGFSLEAEKIHVEYILEIDQDNPSNSRMQVLANDKLVFENPNGSALFSKPVDYLSEIRISFFNSTHELSAIGFDNLVVTVFEK